MWQEPPGATPLDADELAGLKLDSIETRGDLDRLEQANIIDGQNWLKRQKAAEVLSEAFLLTLHHRLFGQVWRWAGEFRRTEKNIGVDPRQIGIELRNLLDDGRYWIEHDSYPVRELALRFHHRLVKIHLFANGNGRHGRIATDALLRLELDQPQIVWISEADLQNAGPWRDRYIAALRSADAGDYTPLQDMYGAD